MESPSKICRADEALDMLDRRVLIDQLMSPGQSYSQVLHCY